jgi:hypothetical protein
MFRGSQTLSVAMLIRLLAFCSPSDTLLSYGNDSAAKEGSAMHWTILGTAAGLCDEHFLGGKISPLAESSLFAPSIMRWR